jgi:hypothetical protein
MSLENFVFWLQGFLELENPKTLSEQQVNIIKDHLKLVLNKKTPNRSQPKESGFDTNYDYDQDDWGKGKVKWSKPKTNLCSSNLIRNNLETNNISG